MDPAQTGSKCEEFLFGVEGLVSLDTSNAFGMNKNTQYETFVEKKESSSG